MADPKVNILITATDRTKGVLGGIGGALSGLGKVALGVAAGGFAALTAVTIKSIGAASDLSETYNKVDVVFGEAAEAIKAYAADSATALGQTTQQALDAASTFGVFGKAAGLVGEPLSDFSTGLTSLASDLASFYNADPSEVITALGAGLRGESEPLRRFGVLLDDATLREKALALGIVSTTKDALTPQQRVLAAQAVIMEQTAIAQGDFARTSDGLANSQRILKAELGNLSATWGTIFLPIAQKVVSFLANDLLPPIANLISTLQDAGLFSSEFTEALGAIVGDKNAKQILAFFKNVYNWLQVALPAAIRFLSMFWVTVLQPAMMAVWNWLSSVFIPFIRNVVVPWLSNLFTPELTGRIGGFLAALQPVWAAVQNLVAAFVESGPAIKGALEDIIASIRGTLGENGPQIISNFTDIINSIAELWREHGDQIVAAVSTAIQWVGQALIGGTTFISGLISGFLKGLTGDWQGAWNTIKSSTETFANGIMRLMGTSLEQVRQTWARNLEMLIAIVILMWKRMFDAGKKIVDGLKSGIEAQWNALVSWLKSKIDALVKMINDALKIHSPSGVFAEIGAQMIAGMAQGMQKGLNMPVDIIGGITAGATSIGGGPSLFIGTQNITIMNGNDIDEIMDAIRQANQQSARAAGSFGYAG